MNDREAIEHLTNDWFKSLGGQLCVDGDKVDGFLEAVGIGISALQEREERSKGCDGCAFFQLRPCNGCSRAYQKDLYEPLKGADHD